MRQQPSRQPTTLACCGTNCWTCPTMCSRTLGQRKERAWPLAGISQDALRFAEQHVMGFDASQIIHSHLSYCPALSWGSNTDLPASLGHGSESRRRRKKTKEVDPHCSHSPWCNQAAPEISALTRDSTNASIPCFLHLGGKLILILNYFLWIKPRQRAIVLPSF